MNPSDRPFPKAIQSGMSHAEAYCLMLYQCETCNFMEILYNSRDGVTPFTIKCRICGEAQSHTSFQLDKYMPNFKSYKGMRIFIDLTEDKARKIYEKSYNNIISQELRDKIFIKEFPTPEEYIKMKLKYFNEGEPTTEVIE